MPMSANWEFRLRRGFVPWISRRTGQRSLDRILAAQIRHYKPDVLVNGSIHWSHEVYREIRPYVRLLVGLHGAPLPAVWDPDVYDMMLSCVDNFVEHFRRLGLRSERLRLAFAPSVLEELGRGLSLVTTRCSCEFLAELSAFDEVVVRMRLQDLTQNRMSLGFEYWRRADDAEELVARGEQQVACMRRERGGLVAAPVPDALRRALEPFAV